MPFLLVASMLLAQTLPTPFPRDGATKVVENDQVVIWDVSWEKGKTTPLHEHRYTALSVTIQPGRVKSTLPDGTTRVGDLEEVGNVQYGGKGLVHREEGVSETPRRVFLIELKETTPPPHPMPAGVAAPFPREGAEKVLENELVAVWDYAFRADRSVPLHYHGHDRVVVELAPGRFRSVSRNGDVRVHDVVRGRARFVPRGTLHREEYVDGAPRVIVIQLKR